MNLDITFCHGKNCPLKENCKRYKFKNRGGLCNSYFAEIPYDEKNKECEYLIEIKKS